MAIKSYSVIVLLIILGIGASVVMAWAIFHYFFNVKPEGDPYSPGGDQAVYMREVRLRNLRNVAAVMGRRDIIRDLDMEYTDR